MRPEQIKSFKVRKVYKPKIGTSAVNLSPYLPDDWKYVEVHLERQTNSELILRIVKLFTEEVGNEVSGKVSEKS